MSGVNFGLFCSTPSVALSRNVLAQAGDGDAAHRRFHRRRGGAGPRPGQPRRRRPTCSMPRSRRWSPRSSRKPRVAIAIGKELFYRQIETGIAAAYAIAGEAMACNMMDDERARRRAGLHRQAEAGNSLASTVVPACERVKELGSVNGSDITNSNPTTAHARRTRASSFRITTVKHENLDFRVRGMSGWERPPSIG